MVELFGITYSYNEGDIIPHQNPNIIGETKFFFYAFDEPSIPFL